MAIPQLEVSDIPIDERTTRISQYAETLQNLHMPQILRNLGRVALIVAEVAELEAVVPAVVGMGIAEFAIKHPPTEPINDLLHSHYSNAAKSSIEYGKEAVRFTLHDSLSAEIAARPLGIFGGVALRVSKGLVGRYWRSGSKA